MTTVQDRPSSPPARPAERRQVSVLFTDMVDYTATVERLGEDEALALTRALHDLLKETVSASGGTVHSFAGDSIMAVFGIPDAQEDAALRACRAGLAIHAAMAAAEGRMTARFGHCPVMRVGISSGLAVMAAVEGDAGALTAVGTVVNLASRVQSLAPPGGTLLCDATRRLVEWLADLDFAGEHGVKGLSRPQRLWRLRSVREGATRFDASLARGLSPFVGREDETARLQTALSQAETALCVVDVVAEAGLGKTRLLFEFLQSPPARGATVLRGHCAQSGLQTPYFPFLEIVRTAFRLFDDDPRDDILRKLSAGLQASGLHSVENLALLLNLLGLDPPEGALSGLDPVGIGLRTRNLLPALLAAQCRQSRVILVIEDLHWIDRASGELLARLVAGSADAPYLLIHTRRPDHPLPWAGLPGLHSLPLQPLGPDHITRIAQSRLGVATLPDPLRRQLTERAAGNPLFGEELLSFFLDQGALRIQTGTADFNASAFADALPASMQSLIAARLQRLPDGDLALLQVAAAIGRRFDPSLVFLAADAPQEASDALERLQAQGIVLREDSSSDYAFRHVLLRDAVYQSLLGERRAALHLAIARAIEARNSNCLPEVSDQLAYHYGLSPRPDLAFTYAAMAGRKSLGVYALADADQYLTAALDLWRKHPGTIPDTAYASLAADYSLLLNLMLQVRRLITFAEEAAPVLIRLGDSRDHVLVLHHKIAALIWNGRFTETLAVRETLNAMAARRGDAESLAYALVSDIAIGCYCDHPSREEFEDRRARAERLLEEVADSYLFYFFLAHLCWDAICRGRVLDARRYAQGMIDTGKTTNDQRSLGYGTAMKALMAMLADDYAGALSLADEALALSRAEFEKAIAGAARSAALIPLHGPASVPMVEEFVAQCDTTGGNLFLSTPQTMIGVAMALGGQIGAGIQHIEAAVARREAEGYQLAADWYRLLLSEIYVSVLAGEGNASAGVLLRNAGTLARIIFTGEKRVVALLDRVFANSYFDRNGHYIARAEMTLGLLYKARKKHALAARHLSEARRIVQPFGPTPMLARIETALSALPPAAQPVSPAR